MKQQAKAKPQAKPPVKFVKCAVTIKASELASGQRVYVATYAGQEIARDVDPVLIRRTLQDRLFSKN